MLKQEKGHHWIVCPDLNTYQKLNEGFLLIDMPQKQSQRIFDFQGSFLIYTKNINQIMQSILSCIQSKNVYLKGFDVIGTQVTITGHTQSELFPYCKGANNNKFEDLRTHDGMAIGF